MYYFTVCSSSNKKLFSSLFISLLYGYDLLSVGSYTAYSTAYCIVIPHPHKPVLRELELIYGVVF